LTVIFLTFISFLLPDHQMFPLPSSANSILPSDSVKATRKPFSVEEDEKLMTFVACHGTKKWFLLANELGNRTAKQCRERWRSHLKPNLNCGPWTAAEERMRAGRHREREKQGQKSHDSFHLALLQL
jgi:hypothetical protein